MFIEGSHILRGNCVRFVTPSAEPHGPVLSWEALQGLSSGQRKATGPMTVPSAPAPCTSAALALMAREVRVASVVVKRILSLEGEGGAAS